MLNKEELINKGNNLVDQINEAITKIELCESAKNKVAAPDAVLAINYFDASGAIRPYDFKKALPEKSIEKIKAFIMSEFDLQMDESMSFLDKVGLRPDVVTTDSGDVYYDDNSTSAEDFELVEDINVAQPEPEKEPFDTYVPESTDAKKKPAKTAKKKAKK